MSKTVWIWGPDNLVSALASPLAYPTKRLASTNDLLSIEPDDWVMEATIGPKALKRQRLKALADAKVSAPVLSQSVTVSLREQMRWVPTLNLTGFDPLLWGAGGHVQTVVTSHESQDITMWERLWPDRKWVVTGDTVGLVYARSLASIINEAAAFLAQGVPGPEIDLGTRLGLNYPGGPVRWAEDWGWDTVQFILEALAEVYGDRYRPHPWIRQQTGQTFFDNGVT